MDSDTHGIDACMIYVTAGSDAEARTIAKTLVIEKLVACANIMGQVHSIYTWKGAVEETQEVVLIAKTRRTLADVVIARIKALHSYEVPSIAVYDMAAGYGPFLNWIGAETLKASD